MINKALSGIPDYAFVILLAHHPEFFEESIERKIPVDSIWTYPRRSNRIHGYAVSTNRHTIYKRSLCRRTKRYCYVNNGTGHWFPIRINCPREITVITFFDGTVAVIAYRKPLIRNVSGLFYFLVHLRYERMLQICHRGERFYFMRTASANSSSVMSFSSKMISLIEQPRFVRFFYHLSALVVANIWC